MIKFDYMIPTCGCCFVIASKLYWNNQLALTVLPLLAFARGVPSCRLTGTFIGRVDSFTRKSIYVNRKIKLEIRKHNRDKNAENVRDLFI